MKQPGVYRWYVVTTLMVGYFFAFLDRAMIGLMVAPIQADLNINDTQMSLLMGIAFALLYSVAGLPLGFLADRVNRVRLLSAGAVVWCAMSAACGLATTFWQLFFARVAVGLGEATLTPAAISLIGDYFKPGEMGRALTVYHLGLAAGAAFALILGGHTIAYIASLGAINLPLIGGLKPWQAVFMLFGVAGFLFVFMLLFVREPERTGRTATNQSFTPRQTTDYLRVHARLYVGLFFAPAFAAIIGFAVLSWMPTFFMRTHDWSVADAGLRYGLTSLTATVLGMVASGWLVDRWTKQGQHDAAWRVMSLGYGALLPAMCLAPLVGAAWLTLLLMLIGIFGAALAAIAAPSAMLAASPNEARGSLIAVYSLISNLFGAAVGPTAVAVLTDYVFMDQGAVGYSIAMVGVISWLGANAFARYGAPSYRARVRQLGSEVAPAPAP